MNYQLLEYERFLIYDPNGDVFLSQARNRWVSSISKAGKWVYPPKDVLDYFRYNNMTPPKELQVVKYYFASKPVSSTPV